MTLRSVNVCSEHDCGLPIRSRGRCNRHYEAHRRRMLAYERWESIRVPAGPVRAHYEALLESGLARNQVSRISGVKTDQLDNLVRPRKDRGDRPAQIVFRRTADRILAVPVPAPHEAWRYAADGQPVDGTGTRRRLQALVALGWTQTVLADRIGWEVTNLSRVLLSEDRVFVRTARSVADLFNELQLTPGGSVRAQRLAVRRGWHPPLAWDEDTIDDPAAVPQIDGDTPADLDEVVVDRGVAWMLLHPPYNRQTVAWRQWRTARPVMTRDERVAVAGRLVGEVRSSLLCDGLGLRLVDFTDEAVTA